MTWHWVVPRGPLGDEKLAGGRLHSVPLNSFDEEQGEDGEQATRCQQHCVSCLSGNDENLTPRMVD